MGSSPHDFKRLGPGLVIAAKSAGALRQRSRSVERHREHSLLHPPSRGREAGHARIPAPVPPCAGWEALDAALGDDITPTLKRLLVRTYDGDLDTLTGLIEAVEAEGDIR